MPRLGDEAMWDINVLVARVGTSLLPPDRAVSHLYVDFMRCLGLGGEGTTTVIVREKSILVVDPGYGLENDLGETNRVRNKRRLAADMQNIGIEPSDVTHVFVTHPHRDHWGTIGLFNQAQWFAMGDALKNAPPEFPADRFTPVADGDEVFPNTRVVRTTGHTRHHASLLWTSADGGLRTAIAGDAVIDLAWAVRGLVYQYNTDFFDGTKARESQAWLLENADLIIPGHGQPFPSGVLKS
jgi:glyoxylase-like metal-dependent hydrolase (beta-lactamase superfamily II)